MNLNPRLKAVQRQQVVSSLDRPSLCTVPKLVQQGRRRLPRLPAFSVTTSILQKILTAHEIDQQALRQASELAAMAQASALPMKKLSTKMEGVLQEAQLAMSQNGSTDQSGIVAMDPALVQELLTHLSGPFISFNADGVENLEDPEWRRVKLSSDRTIDPAWSDQYLGNLDYYGNYWYCTLPHGTSWYAKRGDQLTEIPIDRSVRVTGAPWPDQLGKDHPYLAREYMQLSQNLSANASALETFVQDLGGSVQMSTQNLISLFQQLTRWIDIDTALLKSLWNGSL